MNSLQKTSLLIMAAGLGSRYGGDKQIDRLGPDGEILLQYSVFDAVRAGFNKIVLVIKPEYLELLEALLADFKRFGVEICFAYQDFSSIPKSYEIPSERAKPFGTVHAVLCAKELINEPFAVINADDFYGADAFLRMHDALLSLKNGQAAMVAYRLKNTLSENGTVTRGVCQIENDTLKNITETYEIGVTENGNITDGRGNKLDGGLPVSMNMWGFSPEIFSSLERSFDEFLKSIPYGDVKAEYVLPAFVDRQIKSGKLCVSVLQTSARWFGVTYKEDRPSVVQRLADMKASGEYPTRLQLQ